MSLLDSARARDLIERAGLGSLSPKALKAVLALGVAVVAVGAWRFWPRAPEPEVAFDAMPAEAESATQDAGEPDAPESLVVHVAGAVLHPGVYELDVGSRVADAIEAAGGGLGIAAVDSLNLARILADGEQVYVPTTDEVAAGTGPPAGSGTASAGGASASGTSADTVNINTASASDLENLPGVGPATAQKIVDDRETNGPFARPEDLMRVPGIGEKKFESLREFVVCG